MTFLYVRHEWTYDAFHENANRIYRVYAEFQAPNKKVYRIPTLQTALRNELIKTVTGVAQAGRLTAGRVSDFEDREIQVTYEDQVFNCLF